MKRNLSLLTSFFFCMAAIAQLPQKMSYQAVIRNNANALVTNQTIGMRISILQGSPSGSSVYAETQNPVTNSNGLVSIEIGGGLVVAGAFSSINWSNGPYFIKTETDPSGGNNYSIIGTSQLLSVPYAFFSGNGIKRVSASGDTLFLGNGSHLIIPGISAANNSGGGGGNTNHTCGATDVHNPNLTYGSVTDINGNVYKTIVIGTQEWMAENLKSTTYSNGAPIPNITDNFQWSSLNSGAWTQYNNNSLYDCPHGNLYNWYAAADARNICPSGWHVPTSDEWNTLIGYLDPAFILNILGSQSMLVGSQLKSTGTQFWQSPNQDANNQTGFSGLPGGTRDSNGSFGGINFIGAWWSSQANGTSAGWSREVNPYNGAIDKYSYDKRVGYSVRCVKN